MRTNVSGKTVASRVLSVLQAFETAGPLLTLTEIAEISEMPLSTAHRITKELVEWGALTRDANGRYQVGLRLWELGQNAGRKLREAARPYLQDLFSLTGETAHLAVREQHEVLYVDRIYSSKRVPRASRIGGRLPLHATAVGKVLLAYEEQWFQEAYLASPLVSLTKQTKVSPEGLTQALAEIAKKGFAVTGEEARAGACSLAVPIMMGSEPGRVTAAIGIVAQADQLPTITRHLPVLQGVGRRIEATFKHINSPFGQPL